MGGLKLNLCLHSGAYQITSKYSHIVPATVCSRWKENSVTFRKKRKGSQLSSLHYSRSVTSDWNSLTNTKTQRKEKIKYNNTYCNLFLCEFQETNWHLGKYHRGSCWSWCGWINTLIVRFSEGWRIKGTHENKTKIENKKRCLGWRYYR